MRRQGFWSIPIHSQKDFRKSYYSTLSGVVSPCDFKAACNRIISFTEPKCIFPTQALFFNALQLQAQVLHICQHRRHHGFCQSVSACNKRNGFFIIHCHTAKGSRISLAAAIGSGFPVRSFRIHIYQSHLHGCKRIFEFAVHRYSSLSPSHFFSEPQRYPAPVPKHPHVRRQIQRF